MAQSALWPWVKYSSMEAMMELLHMRYFVAVAEELSLTKAAQKLHTCLSPVSRGILRLEEEIGAALLFRSGRRGVYLTGAGRAFLEECRRALAHADRSVVMARRAAAGDSGHLAVGYNSVSEHGVLPQIIRAFAERYPSIHLTLRGLRTPEQLAALASDRLDLGFVCPPIAGADYDMLELTRQRFVAVLPARHRLAGLSVVTYQDLHAEPLVLYSKTLDADAFQQIKQRFLQAGAELHIAYELDTPALLINFVATGSCCSILPDYVRTFGRDDIVCKELTPPIWRRLSICKKKASRPAADSFYEFAAEQVSSQAL
jgi:DNA-binding transcriptional LysR family regulator